MTYETWRAVIGFPGYEISDQGQVKSLPRRNLQGAMRRGRILKHDVNWAGYHLVRLARDGVKHARLVHRLVLETFTGACPEGLQSRHLNGVRSDNRLCNLEWGTIQENRADQKRHGTGIQGARNPKAVLTEIDVERVLDLRRFGLSQAVIGRQIGVHQAHVSKLLRGKHWTQAAA
jgi:hypothetical protein